MYRLLIADDEALEREGLEWIITRMMPDTFEIIHADNGRVAIQKADEHRPHIVLMDVRMPGIQGLDALKEIKERNPLVKMVLITAYEYFDYAKQALSLGVKEYLVKPAKREQIVSILQRLVDEIKDERRKRDEQLAIRDKFFQLLPLAETELSLALMADQAYMADALQLADILELSLDRGYAIVVAIKDMKSASGLQLAENWQLAVDAVKNAVKEQIKDRFNWIASPIIHEHMAIFILDKETIQGEPMKEDVSGIGTEIINSLRRQCGLDVMIGVGTIQHHIEGIRRSYYEAVFASTCPNSWGSLCRFEDLQLAADNASWQPDDRYEHGTAAEGAYVEHAIKRIREEREQQTGNVVDRAAAYILDRYDEELSLEEVAEHVHLNPHYFSKVFKQQTGETFIDYVTRLRIDKAKVLILDGQYSLKEVCYMVGYKDPNYFSRVFKKVTGVTPTEYRSTEN
ncbi:AraC family transcriptional regulator [Paenibacillus alvei]|uniref:AraC family transcriptional regulator n=1 Tax=Paenibacillus alvei TaxID=44250 RepID=UPI0018CDD85F|nr:AraC family transcriptional regulator [Paenibacillus alvei]MBG9735263.1 chemotaxis protein CheY [Paenibacillus alvei]MBG9743720.1 chemotaxis protein CheY [Paenibacillus alvei]MCY9580147.1 AraC family transcriptional regulator [Paenibacillus alvei]MCY9584322.1 AraC family transcriptional regulator [Paenibacillus alvei]